MQPHTPKKRESTRRESATHTRPAEKLPAPEIPPIPAEGRTDAPRPACRLRRTGGNINSDFPMPQPYCTNAVEGILLRTKADGWRISERAVCPSFGEQEALLASNDPLGTKDMATSTLFRSTGG